MRRNSCLLVDCVIGLLFFLVFHLTRSYLSTRRTLRVLGVRRAPRNTTLILFAGGSPYPKHTPPYKWYPAQHLPQQHRTGKGGNEGKAVDAPHGQCGGLEPQTSGGTHGHMHDIESEAAARHVLREGCGIVATVFEESDESQRH